jgi:cystathionine beta-lyase/cystathionine gamma-synthase
MARHCANAVQVAEWLEQRRGVRQVRYPFLPSHPQHALAREQMRGGSGIVTLELACSQKKALGFCRSLELFTMAESLGGVESLLCHPASMTHASVPAEVRRRVGIMDGLLRLSVGVEDSADLIEDLDRGLKGAGL